MIAVIDTGGANLASVANAITRLGRKWRITTDPLIIQSASHVLLPGVGTAIKNWQKIDSLNLVPVIKNLKQPVLGICVGMQLLFEGSDEGNSPCLGIIPGRVSRFQPVPDLTIPHTGWNQVEFEQSSPLFKSIKPRSYFYFVHSFRADLSSYTHGSAKYGHIFSAAVNRDNFFGTQFHPERSSTQGACLLENFFSL